MDDDNREVTLEHRINARQRGDEVAVVLALEQVHHDFGVGLGPERVAFLDELRLELAVVLDDPVEDDRDLRGVAAGERMRILDGDAAVRGPPRMAQPVA
jgi:hypothetical protein